MINYTIVKLLKKEISSILLLFFSLLIKFIAIE